LLPALVLVLGFLLMAPTEASACMQQARPGTGDYDKHDFSGIWFRAMPRNIGGDCGFGPQGSYPPLTPAGEAAIRKNAPTNTRHPLQPKVGEKDPSQSNDPALTCNPKGFPQIVVDTAHDHHEVVQTPTRILQIWQEERRLREIWMDGRPLPSGDNLANLGNSWYGMSVGRWEGDTLVVDTVGLDERAWLDIYGFPKSGEARIEERYRLADAETLEVQLTLNDPKYYTKPWVSDVKRFKREARDAKTVNNFGWYGLFSSLVDLICAPVNAGGTPSNPRGGD
jgi:hypothetical protein